MKQFFKSMLILVRSREELGALMPFASWFGIPSASRLDFVAAVEEEADAAAIAREIAASASMTKAPHSISRTEKRDLKTSIPSLVAERDIALLVVCAELSPGDSGDLFEPELRAVIETIEVPVLVVPRQFERRQRGCSILVPMSGEVREDKALELSLTVGCALGLPVDIIHVTQPAGVTPATIDRYADGAYHEFPKMIDEFIVEATPLTKIEKRKCLRNFYISRGQTTEEILGRINQNASELVAVQWQGTFMTGHARILKAILRESKSAVLLVKRKDDARFNLRAGSNLRSLTKTSAR